MGHKGWPAQNIYDLHQQGLSVLQISDTLLIPRPTVYYHLKKEGLRPHTTNRPELTSRQAQKVVDLWERYLPVPSIAKQLGISYDQARYQIKKYQSSDDKVKVIYSADALPEGMRII